MSLLGRWLSWDRFEAVREHEEILAGLPAEKDPAKAGRKAESGATRAVSNALSKTFKYRR